MRSLFYNLTIFEYIDAINISDRSQAMCYNNRRPAFHKTGDLPHHDHGHVDGLDEVTEAPLTPTAGGSKP